MDHVWQSQTTQCSPQQGYFVRTRCHVLLRLVKHAEIAVHLKGFCRVASLFIQVSCFGEFALVSIDVGQKNVVVDVLGSFFTLQNIVD